MNLIAIFVVASAFQSEPALSTTAPSAAAETAAARSVTLIDFGSDNQARTGANIYDYSFGPGQSSRAYDPTSLTISGTASSGFQVFGQGFGGGFGPNPESHLIGKTIPLAPNGFLTLVGGFNGAPTMDVYDIRVVLMGPEVDGKRDSSTYRFTAQANDGGNPPKWTPAPFATSTSATNLATTPLDKPVETTGNGFVFGQTALDQIQIVIQNGNGNGEFQLVVDKITISTK